MDRLHPISIANFMATKLFIDTWGWLTLNDRQETGHQGAIAIYKQFLRDRGSIYTTDYVLDETYTLLFKRLPTFQAQKSMQSIFDALTRDSRFTLVWITEERFQQTQNLRMQYLDKPRISFTDLTSMVVMQELGIQHILTGDAHFEHIGLGFQKVP